MDFFFFLVHYSYYQHELRSFINIVFRFREIWIFERGWIRFFTPLKQLFIKDTYRFVA